MQNVSIIGFSRGAAIANQVAWILNNRGIIDGESVLAQPGEAKVRFLGLFDTVHSMSLPGKNSSGSWHDETIAPNVEYAAHAIAADERRNYFIPSDVQPTSSETVFHRAIFPGVHSDIGGNNSTDQNQNIASLTRHWMASHAMSAGINNIETQDVLITRDRWNNLINNPELMNPGSMGLPSRQFVNPVFFIPGQNLLLHGNRTIR